MQLDNGKLKTEYKSNTLNLTATTTASGCYLYEIDGPQGKSVGMRPLLGSVNACKKYINDRLEREAARLAEQRIANRYPKVSRKRNSWD